MEKCNALASGDSTILRGSSFREKLQAAGKYTAKCFDKNGNLKWEDTIDNVVTDVGANLMLDQLFGNSQLNSAYFLGLISSVGYTGIPVVGDTMASHSSAGHVWVEAGNGSNYPNWSTPASNARATCAWNAAAARAKALSAALSFTIATNGGTVKGCFIVTGTGAVATNNSTAGTLYSAGVFTGGDKVLAVADVLQVSYSTSV
jgi:hypothetical protein